MASLYAAGAAPERTRGADDFTHRLATPLDSQSVSLRLRKLDDEDASTHALRPRRAAGALAAIGGLFALYRMVGGAGALRRAAQQLRRRRHARAQDAADLDPHVRRDVARRHGHRTSARASEYYATITAEGERLTRLINNVMEHGKLRQGQRLPDLVQRQVGDVVREVVELMAPHIEHEGFALELHIDAELPRGAISTSMRSSRCCST